MFMFNKNNSLPRSRQSSIDDSLGANPPNPASNADAWAPQSPQTFTRSVIPSPDHRESPHPEKRASVFNLRARSNTTSSATPSFVSVASSMTGSEGSKRSSQELRHFAGHGFMEGGRRSLFGRGKRGKRLSGPLSPVPTVDETEDIESGNKRISVLRKGRRGNRPTEGSGHHFKHRISSPFDFQHITHTDRNQYAVLEQTSGNDLIAEFWAVRASQTPRSNLTGIKADNLNFQNSSSENLTGHESRSASALGFKSPPHSPEPSQDWQQPESPLHESSGKIVRLSRSVESFSRPGVIPRSHRHTQSANPAPPRSSSRSALARIDDLPEEVSSTTRSPPSTWSNTNRQSALWDSFAPLSPSVSGEMLPTILDDPDDVGHAVTTPDETAIHPVTPPFSPSMEYVPEEAEPFVSPRPAPRPPVRSPKSPNVAFFDPFALRNNQRTPISRSHNRSPFTSPKSTAQRGHMTRPISQMSDTLGSPINLSRRSSIRRVPPTRRKSNTWRVIEESWEDDVDYIYDNALEADCDFDWEHASNSSSVEDRDRTPEQRDHERPSTAISQVTQTTSTTSEEDSTFQTRFFPGTFRPSLLVPRASSVPELEARSAVSASTAESGIQTPSDPFGGLEHRRHPFTEAEGFTLTPSLLVPADFKEQMSREAMYDDLIADYESSDRHFPLIDASQSTTSSTRSSHVRSSKRSSYDSSLISSGQATGSGTWSSPVRRSASSSGSLPELVHSRHARKDFNVIVDRLSEQVASFGSLGQEHDEDEDDDTTPPGRLSQERTFFTTDNEDDSTTHIHKSIEGEVRASLELARQGSTRASRTSHQYHKYASSDGAAKLLASPMPSTPELQQPPRSRLRAASSSNAMRGNRQPYLSLFPAPPKHSPLSPVESSAGSPVGNNY
ncbi:hypothetical protein CC78DRAFT_326324 [Lojkania enalia]|uniref:CRIB domain-containing protein n=1 Tax=Lojkania enalia TaxID=147567 RepID=A0A9P4MY47_9PLEO|nr:hypothetical protein CC78DRAFT_326324 [Didymosphaeria enalia]